MLITTFPCGAFFYLLMELLEKAEKFEQWGRGQRDLVCGTKDGVTVVIAICACSAIPIISNFQRFSKHWLGGKHFFKYCYKLKEKKKTDFRFFKSTCTQFTDNFNR